jgi:RNA-directed DNA polymerase
MESKKEHVQIIRELFQKMNSKNDFLELLNIAKHIYYGEKVIPFEEKQLNYYINKSVTHNRNTYTTFIVKKKSGAERKIHAPVKGLKEFQKSLNLILQCVYVPHTAAKGFIIGKSIVDNAIIHINQNYVYNIDLKDFFPSIDKSRIWGRLLTSPFNLNNTPERKKIANMIATLSCTQMEVERLVNNEYEKVIMSVLPQGAPTSPSLTNAICEKLDVRLSGVAKRFGLNYSRYADDITFSSKHNSYEVKKGVFENIFLIDSTFDKEIRRIIDDQKFNINESKVRLQRQGYRQEVTGITVNKKVNVNRKYSNSLRKWLYLWETYGYEKAYKIFIKKYSFDKGHIKKGQPNMMMVIDGKLLYLKMVKGENDSTYLILKEKFDILVGVEKRIINENKNIVDLILDIGLDKAMKHYNK